MLTSDIPPCKSTDPIYHYATPGSLPDNGSLRLYRGDLLFLSRVLSHSRSLNLLHACLIPDGLLYFITRLRTPASILFLGAIHCPRRWPAPASRGLEQAKYKTLPPFEAYL